MEKDTKELLETLELMCTAVKNNPCQKDSTFFGYLAKTIKGFIISHFDMSLTQVARYFRTSVRTIERWQDLRGFPRGQRNGHKELSFNIEDILKWEKEQQQKDNA